MLRIAYGMLRRAACTTRFKQWNTKEAQYYLNTRNELDNLPPEQLSEDKIDQDINTFKSF